MRNPTATRVFIATVCLSLVAAVTLESPTLAAPDNLKCKAKYDPTKVDPNPDSPGWNVNCFANDVFILDGSQPARFVAETEMTRQLVDCRVKATKPDEKDPRDCYLELPSFRFTTTELVPATELALKLISARAPQLPEWDEIVVLRADFEPLNLPKGPLFYRDGNSAAQQVNLVANIGLPLGARDKPYQGLIDGGNTRAMTDEPDMKVYEDCGQVPFPGELPSRFTEPEGTVCPPGIFTYFDALAQATAHLYGPYLQTQDNPQAMQKIVPFTTPVSTKEALVSYAGQGAAVPKQMPAEKYGPMVNVWNSFLDMQGSLLGGNTFRPRGDRHFEVGAPPLLRGVSPRYEGSQRPRFHPLDLYVMGLLPFSEVPAIPSFRGATVGHIPQLVGQPDYPPGISPSMGTRISEVAIREEVDFLSQPDVLDNRVPVVPKPLDMRALLAANGGERQPSFQAAPQFIRQLWIVVTKPPAILDAAARDLGVSEPETRAEKLAEQQKDQVDQILNVQKARRRFADYFHMLTGWRGRIYNAFEGNVDDNPYWEFGGARDDGNLFMPAGGLLMEMKGQEPIANSGGKLLNVLRLDTPGEAGKIVFNPQGGHPIRIDGDQSGQTPTNVVTVRLRVPSDPGLLAALVAAQRAGGSHEGGFFATLTLEGGPTPVTVRIPRKLDGKGDTFLVPDGNFRSYSVLLNDIAEFKQGGVWTSFTLTPSNRAVKGIEIDSIRIGYADAAKDTDLACDGKTPDPDGWPDGEDNCPTVHNPTQEDGNGDGIGDACEDFDGDKAPNACDNCPLISNSSQRDRNDDQAGDACDPESTEGCISDGSVAGQVNPRPSALALLALALLGTIAVARRRRR